MKDQNIKVCVEVKDRRQKNLQMKKSFDRKQRTKKFRNHYQVQVETKSGKNQKSSKISLMN